MTILTTTLNNRCKAIFDSEKHNRKVTIIGAGTIGSNVALVLARLGIPFEIYDDDYVEDYNIGYQQFFEHQIGMPKVEAIAETVEKIAGYRPVTFNQKADKVVTDILILCVDNMEARKHVVENSFFTAVVDGRMGGELFNVFTHSSKEDYLKTWHSDDDALEEPCGAKAISYIGSIIGGVMANQVKKVFNREELAKHISFATSYLNMEAFDHGPL